MQCDLCNILNIHTYIQQYPMYHKHSAHKNLMYTTSLSSRPKSKHAYELSNLDHKLSVLIIHIRHYSSPILRTTIGPTRSYGTDPIPEDTLVPQSQELAEATYKLTPQYTHFRKTVLCTFFQIFPCQPMHISKQIKISYYVLVIQLK